MTHKNLNVAVSLALLLSILAACGGQAPPAPATIAPTVAPTPTTAVQPTQTSSNSSTSGNGSSGSLLGNSSKSPTATPKPTSNEVAVNTLYVTTNADGTAGGGTSKASIKVSPAQEKGNLRVGFFEEEVGGIGQQWHSSGWMAVTLASMLLGIDPRNYEFSFSTGGRIDGPSAGGLLTIATLAALRGDKVSDDMAMTGTINPDGTIGPVGGIPQKIQGAASAHFKTVLIPAGQRYDYDVNKQQTVDLVELGKNLGVNVKEVSNVYEAYPLLTGSPLPRPQASSSSPQLPPRSFDRVKAKAQEWYGRYNRARNQFDAISQDITKYWSDSASSADDSASKADSALKQGLASVAYQRALDAGSNMQVALLQADMYQKYQNGGLDAAISELKSSAASAIELDATVSLLKSQDPKTVSDQLALVDAYGNIGQGQGFLLLADSKINDLQQNSKNMQDSDILQALMEAASDYSYAGDYVQFAKDAIDISFGNGGTLLKDPNRVQGMSELLRRAADANISFFETVIVDEYAKKWEVSDDQAKNAFMSIDSDYLQTEASNIGTQQLASSVNEQPAQSSLVLGQGVGAYSMSAGLIAKYYSLDAQLDKDGKLTGIGRERALADMLDLADQRAKELINLNGDDIPVPAVIYYENARLLRQGTANDQLFALSYYWQATALATTGAYLSGKFSSAGQ